METEIEKKIKEMVKMAPENGAFVFGKGGVKKRQNINKMIDFK